MKFICLNIKYIQLYLCFVTKILKKLKISYKIVNLPKNKKKLSLLKSPHVYKKAFEQFQFSSYKTNLLIKTSNFDLLKFIVLNKPKFLTIKTTILGR